MATDTAKLVDQLGKMTVLELVELKNKLEEEWGVTAAAPVAVAAAGAPAAGGDGAAAEEQSTFEARVVTELTLVPCTEDFESQQTFPTSVQFLVFNEFEKLVMLNMERSST